MSDDDKSGARWRAKYEALKLKVALLADELEIKERRQPTTCDSTSDEFFVSNGMDICDSESYARKTGGPGKFFRVVKADSVAWIRIEGIYESALKEIAESNQRPPWDRPDARRIALDALKKADAIHAQNETE